ncbi:MAG: T9SS type A sorting domain-containing protein, partial [Planctomycetes bacterium]|nr:T9SS type A sorting domain-containing protein [Planctomycetota bacterium]
WSKTNLFQNYPNPFNPSTTIGWSLSSAGAVSLNIYNARGQLVRRLVDNRFGAGEHTATWNGSTDDGQPVGSGIYLYRLQTADRTETKRMILMK